MTDFSKRLEKAKETGFLEGVNELRLKRADELSMLYRDEERNAYDNWLIANYTREYYRGQDERATRSGNKVINFDPYKAMLYSKMRKADIAFGYGYESRDNQDTPCWSTDLRLSGMLSILDSEEDCAFMLDAWLAGFFLREDEIEEEKEEEKQYTVDFSRMQMLRQAYENNEEFEVGSEEAEALSWFRTCAERLKEYSDGYEIKCLSCRNLIRLLNDAHEDSDDDDETGTMNVDCQSCCYDCHQQLDFICQPELSWLKDYYVVEV